MMTTRRTAAMPLRRPRIGGLLALTAGVLAVCLGISSLMVRSAHAQTADEAGSYLTPFPGGDVYKLMVVGDGLAEGILGAFTDSLAGDPRLEVDRKMRWLSGVSRPDHVEETKEVGQAIVSDKKHIVVVLLGSQDRWSLRGPDGRRLAVGSREWRDAYGRRIGDVMRNFKSNGAAVYWVGLPIMRRPEVNEAAQAVNEVIRERAYLTGIKFIDVYAGFADENGEFSPYGPDLAGTQTRLRERDGILMTDAGYAKLAHFVEREVKRDLAQAKNERSIPLAGSEEEQSRINPGARPAAGRSASAGAAAAAGSGAGTGKSLVGALAAQSADTSGDQKADNARISVKVAASDGRDETFAVEILRPAIPAAVVSLVTRRESADKAAQMGDSVVDQIPGGLTVMSSITPSSDSASGGARRKVSPAQTPFFRVLVKGERITPRAGRADDSSWPRPEPPPAPRRAAIDDADAALSAAAEAEAEATPNVATGSLPGQKQRSRRQNQR